MQHIFILTFISAVFAESNISIKLYLDCSKLQFWEREKVLCNASTPVFQCAWDLFSNRYESKCVRKPILIRIGNRPTIQGGLHYGPCSKDRYQPFHIVSNRTVDCWYLKNNCTDEGQVLCDNKIGDLDRTCRCDYTKGYAFVQSPQNTFYCIPSEEDCSCYKKICSNKKLSLNPDYECVESYNPLDFNGTCPIIDKSGVTTQKTNNVSSPFAVKRISVSESGIAASVAVFFLTLSAIILVFGILKFGTLCARRCKTCMSVKYSRSTIISNTKQQTATHRQDDTYFKTSTVNRALEILHSFNTLIIVGLEGSGKSSLCLEIAKLYEDNGFKVLIISSNDMKNTIHYIRPNLSEMYICDVNLKPGEKEDIIKLCKSYCKSSKLKFIITTSSNYGSDDLFQDKFEVKQYLRLDPCCVEDKIGILNSFMNKTKIIICDNNYESNYDDPAVIKNPNKTVKMYKRIFDKIIDTNTLAGFPSACQKFCSNRDLLHLEHRYFNTPPRSIIFEINALRKQVDVAKKIKYAVLVYIMMNESTNLIKLHEDKEKLRQICKSIDADVSDLELKFYKLKDYTEDLVKRYFKYSCNFFEFNHKTMSKAVWMSYIDVDPIFCVLNCSWNYVEDYIRPLKWDHVPEYDVCIPVSNSLLIERLENEISGGSSWSVGQYLLKCYPSCCEFIDTFCRQHMKKKDIKLDVLLNLCSAFSKVGTSFELFKKCLSAKDMLFLRNIDKFGNCLLHYCVLQDYGEMLSNIPDTIIDNILNVINGNGYSPCHLEFYFGRKEMIKKHIHRIPRTYEYYSKLNKLYHVGEKNFGRIIETKHLNVIGQMNLQSDVLQREKFGSKLDFIFVQDMLLTLKKDSFTMVRIEKLPKHVHDTEIAKVLEELECKIIRQYRERYRQKGRITNIETGDRIVICEPITKPLPKDMMIFHFEVTVSHDGQNMENNVENDKARQEK